MSKILNLIKIKRDEGYLGLLYILSSKLLGKNSNSFVHDLLYLRKHHNLPYSLVEDVAGWKSYIYLKEEFGDFLERMPYYQLESTSKTKVIWWCWLQGEENAPLICKKCLASLRSQFPDYDVRVVTEENMFSLVNMPDHIINKYHKDIISRTHFSDILRTCLLVEHGGVWIDSTVYCTGYHEPVFDEPLFVFQDWKFDRQQSSVCSNWFISAWKGEPILKAVRDLLFEYWKRHDDLLNYYIYHQFFHLATEKFVKEWKAVPRFSNIPPHLLQFELFDPFSEKRFEQFKRGSDFHKLTYKHPLMLKGVEGSFYNKIVNS